MEQMSNFWDWSLMIMVVTFLMIALILGRGGRDRHRDK